MRHEPSRFCSGTFHFNKQPRRPALLKALVAGPELGMEKCCLLVDISCNYNLDTSVRGISIHKAFGGS